ncbi:60S ribosomal protein L9-B [Frankliniella fusca]|uniref:60S ribosomal protein L9-B n=1 Tax=Frankliniella fusca TaxID=407009 RepID=A0AAE1GR18_9NEOP|nr:60S ribosomal protein L9-B [Frankliniella fusca]
MSKTDALLEKDMMNCWIPHLKSFGNFIKFIVLYQSKPCNFCRSWSIIDQSIIKAATMSMKFSKQQDSIHYYV